MDLKEAGRPSRDYSNNRKVFTVTLYEGDLKYSKNGIDRKTGMTVGQHYLTAPIPLQAPQPSQCKKYFIDLLVITPYIAVYYIIYSY